MPKSMQIAAIFIDTQPHAHAGMANMCVPVRIARSLVHTLRSAIFPADFGANMLRARGEKLFLAELFSAAPFRPFVKPYDAKLFRHWWIRVRQNVCIRRSAKCRS